MPGEAVTLTTDTRGCTRGGTEGWETGTPASQILWATAPQHNPYKLQRGIMKSKGEVVAANTTGMQCTDYLKVTEDGEMQHCRLPVISRKKDDKAQPVHTSCELSGAF